VWSLVWAFVLGSNEIFNDIHRFRGDIRMDYNLRIADVKELRAKTSAGLMQCKEALIQSKGDVEAAID